MTPVRRRIAATSSTFGVPLLQLEQPFFVVRPSPDPDVANCPLYVHGATLFGHLYATQ